MMGFAMANGSYRCGSRKTNGRRIRISYTVNSHKAPRDRKSALRTFSLPPPQTRSWAREGCGRLTGSVSHGNSDSARNSRSSGNKRVLWEKGNDVIGSRNLVVPGWSALAGDVDRDRECGSANLVVYLFPAFCPPHSVFCYLTAVIASGAVIAPEHVLGKDGFYWEDRFGLRSVACSVHERRLYPNTQHFITLYHLSTLYDTIF